MSNLTVGVFGKVPAQADFLKVNGGEFSRLGMDRWFQQAHEVLEGERGRLPDEPGYFVLAPAGSDRVVLGVLAPSRDAVGRVFPLIVFGCLDLAECVDNFPSLPIRYARFFQGAAAIAASASSLNATSVTAYAHRLSEVSGPDEMPPDEAFLANEALSALGLALGGLPHGAAYSLRTLSSACDQARGTPVNAVKGAVTLDAPAPTDGARLFWLELARRRLGWRDTMPSFLWTVHTTTRLLLMPGPPSSSLFAFLANPHHKSSRFWPLRTEVESALNTALAALGPDHRRLLESPGGTLADVLGAFA